MENEANVNATSNAEQADTSTTPKTPTVEELMTQLAQEKATSAKYKSSIDKLTKSNGDLTKQLRDKMTAEEQMQIAKAEEEEKRNAELTELKNFKRMAEAKDRYMTIQKMDAETAQKASEAEINGDYVALSNIQQQFNEAMIKAKEAEWQKSRPPINAGVGNSGEIDKSKIDKMSYSELVEFKKSNPEAFNKYFS